MATLKHIASKNADYGAAEQYLTFEHDEFTGKPILDENGRLVPREDYRISSLNCGGEDFAIACMRANLRYGKNQKREDVKSHHYILSFDPRDGPDHGLTMDKAQALGERFCAEQFPGHQALICTHPDGHNHSGNIHVHIVINSLRIEEVERKPYMDRASDTQAGAKHRCTAARVAKPVREGLAAQKTPKARAAYRQEHEADIIRSEAAVRFFKANGITKFPPAKELTAEIEALTSAKNAEYTEYQEKKRRANELLTVKRNIDQMLHGAPSQRRNEHGR